MPNPTRHVLPRLLAVIAMGLALLVPSVAGAVSAQKASGSAFSETQPPPRETMRYL
jgi:hypothetical protein